MNTCDIIQLLNKQYEEPSFVVNSFNIDSCNVGRGFTKDPKDQKLSYILQTFALSVSQIVEDKLIPVESIGAFVNTNTYLVQWSFTMVHEQMELILENVFFYWKGSKAPKGLSPLPPDIDNETAIVNRIVQWSEPAVFFHLLEKNRMVVFEENFNPSSPHLFIVRGELSNELHLYEVPFMKKNLRSRGVFVIAVPQTRNIYVWRGSKITNELNEVVKGASLGVTLRNYVDSWKNFEILEMKETEEDDLFVEDSSEYWHVKEVCNFSPKLFFLNTIIGEFAAIEVEYPLRSKYCVAAFPFLQSYLSISDDQPGYFLLDNNHEIWLITCDLEPSETLRELEALATQFARSYTEEKGKMLSVSIPLKFVKLDSVPIEFTNIFPHWN